MKRDRSSFGVEENVPTSITNSRRLSRFDKIRDFCQQHVEPLGAQLPLIAAWIVYQDFESEAQNFVNFYEEKNRDLHLDLSSLESEGWLVEDLSTLQLREVALEESFKTYVCLLSYCGSHPEYLLFLSREPLSTFQQAWIEQQARSIDDYLTVCRECDRQQRKLQLLEQILQRAEHQLRNPLALIGLYSDNLCLSLTGDLQEQATVIRETVNDLSNTLTNLFYCGKQANLQVDMYDLRQILTASIKILEPWLKQKQLLVCYPKETVELMGGSHQIKQVFDNILNNAIYFSPIGGTITCNWQVFHQEVLIEISDQGPGFSEEDLKKAFTPFYTRRAGGTGLGLAIVQKNVLDHQGSLWIQNLPEGGAQISFSLPKLSNLKNHKSNL